MRSIHHFVLWALFPGTSSIVTREINLSQSRTIERFVEQRFVTSTYTLPVQRVKDLVRLAVFVLVIESLTKEQEVGVLLDVTD